MASAREMGNQGALPAIHVAVPTARQYALAKSDGDAQDSHKTAHKPSVRIYKARGDKTDTNWASICTSNKFQLLRTP